jgi:hypothetical protein
MSTADARLPARGGEFTVTRRGYSPAQVEDYLRGLDAQAHLVAADRDALVEHRAELLRQLEAERAETERLRERLRCLARAPESAEQLGERLRVVLEVASEEVAELRRRADEDTGAMLAAAEVERRRGQQQRHQLERERAELAGERLRVRRTLATARREAEQIIALATARAERMIADGARELARAREEAARRRDEGARLHETALHGVRVEAARMVADARAQAEQLIAWGGKVAGELTDAAHERAEELREADARVRSHLAGLRGLLDHELARLNAPVTGAAPEPGEPEAAPWGLVPGLIPAPRPAEDPPGDAEPAGLARAGGTGP